MQTLSVRISPEMMHRLTTEAKRRKTSKSAIIRESLEAYLKSESRKGIISVLDAAWDLAGSCEGPSDLATNKKYMKGFGKD